MLAGTIAVQFLKHFQGSLLFEPQLHGDFQSEHICLELVFPIHRQKEGIVCNPRHVIDILEKIELEHN